MSTPTPAEIYGAKITRGNQCNVIQWDSIVGGVGFIIRYSKDSFPSHINDKRLATVHTFSTSGSVNHYVHTGLTNGDTYYYSMWGVSNFGSSPYTSGSIELLGGATPENSAQFFDSITLTGSKLGNNTILYGRAQKTHVADTIIWLSPGQIDKKQLIVDAINNIKPAHTAVRVFWEPYYVAATTSAQFNGCSFDAGVYTVISGSVINIAATIDSSFGGPPTV